MILRSPVSSSSSVLLPDEFEEIHESDCSSYESDASEASCNNTEFEEFENINHAQEQFSSNQSSSEHDLFPPPYSPISVTNEEPMDVR